MIGDEGAKHLAKIFTTNSTLKELNLVSNNITNVGFQALNESLKVNNSLEKLSLTFNRCMNIERKVQRVMFY